MALFVMRKSGYIKQVGDEVPRFVKASRTFPALVSLSSADAAAMPTVTQTEVGDGAENTFNLLVGPGEP